MVEVGCGGTADAAVLVCFFCGGGKSTHTSHTVSQNLALHP